MISENESINMLITKSLEFIDQKDQEIILRKFKNIKNTNNHKLHLFRELILGAFISSKDFNVCYENNINGKTPDWCILDSKSNILTIIELTNIHIDKVTENKIDKNIKNNKPYFFWRDEEKDNQKRIYDNLLGKVNTYKEIVLKLKIPYFVAIYFDLNMAFHKEEMDEILLTDRFDLFNSHPELSGVIAFESKSERYIFTQFLNPNALNPFQLCDGSFP